MLYWQIGRDILDRQQAEGWGSEVIERLSRDLRAEFPEMKGFSRTNLFCMRAFAGAYPDESIVQHAWSRNVLALHIESRLAERQGKAQTNFALTLPAPRSDLAQQVLKDPYSFDFLTLGDEAHERDLERGLLGHLQRFLLAMGAGFAFVGSQHHLQVAPARQR